jgi:hypothetical protein
VSNRDPFFRSVLIIADRIAVFLALSTLALLLIWDAVCRHTLGLFELDALRVAISVVRGRATAIEATLFVLAAAAALMGTAIVSRVLFSLWRRRAQIDEGHVRGPKGDA